MEMLSEHGGFFLFNRLMNLMRRKVLSGLRSSDYQHPSDVKYCEILCRTPLMPTMLRSIYNNGVERALLEECKKNYIEVTASGMPGLHALFTQTCAIVDMPYLPRLYVAEMEGINANSRGSQESAIVVSANAVDELTEPQMAFLLGHELAHIKSWHTVFRLIAHTLTVAGGALGEMTFGLGKIASVFLRERLTKWIQMAEFTADRLGLLACQDIDAAFQVLLRIGGLPLKYQSTYRIHHFKIQCDEWRAQVGQTHSSRAMGMIVSNDSEHPVIIERGEEMLRWLHEGSYENLLGRSQKFLG